MIDQPHLRKVKFFEDWYPNPLINNEWRFKFPIGITKTGRTATYNPDYYSPNEDLYIEVTTSKPNISEQGPKWEKALRLGLNLKVYWWEGEDVTSMFVARANGKLGGRPKKK